MRKKICLTALFFLAAWLILPDTAGAMNIIREMNQNEDFVKVEDITGVPATITQRDDIILSGTVDPVNATNKTIDWSLVDAGTTRASIRVENKVSILSATASGDLTVRGTITDGLAPDQDFKKDFKITVKSDGGVSPAITTPALLPGGRVAEVYSQTLAATGTTPITWTFAGGSLPNGLSINSNGIISGTPMTAGTFSFTAGASNNAGDDTKVLSITVDPAAAIRPNITTNSLRTGYLESYYSETLYADGTPPITWTIVSGRLPRGLYLYPDNGVISGRPTDTGTSRFTVRAANRAGYHERNLSITVREDYIFGDGCGAGAGYTAAVVLLMGIRAALGERKKRNRKPF